MRVLAVVPNYPPGSLVGAWISTHACLARLAASGHEVTVVPYLTRCEPYVLDGVYVRPSRGGVADLVDQADVVVSHLGDNGVTHRLAMGAGVPSVRMVHGDCVGMADRLEGTSLAVFNAQPTAGSSGWDGPSIVIPPPIHPDQYRTTPGSEVTLVNVSKAKGSEVFWALAERMPDVRFLGVMGGYGAPDIRQRSNVDVIPPTVDMRGVYSCTRVLLMPSEKETYGRVALEAAVSGIPTIAHPTPGLVDSLGPAGVFVDRDDLDGWARALRGLLVPDVWSIWSDLALARAAALDPDADLDRFATALEALV